ncbi:MAG: DEAD/DEAH box helicase [Verrucomicrobia bacterium]|nr:DEAD/DEAH box helicase [Verrucomicrobiota bacterium]
MSDSSSVPSVLSKEMLLEIGGWRAMQEGRSLWEAGKVMSVEWIDPVLGGVVQAGTGTVNARLKLGKRLSDVENLCSCRQAREYGTVCPHVIALSLKYLEKNGKGVAGPAPRPNGAVAGPVAAAARSMAPRFPRVLGQLAGKGSKPLSLEVHLPLELGKAWRAGKIPLTVEASVDGGPTKSLDAVPVDKVEPYIVDESDAALLAMLEKMEGASVHGEAELSPAMRDAFFPVLLGHPRVFVGRRKHLSVSRATEGTRVKAELDDGGILHLELVPAPSGPEGSELLEAGNGRWRLAAEQLELLDSLPQAYEGLRKGSRTVAREGLATFLQREMPQLERHVRMEPGERLRNLQFETMAPKIRVELDGLLSGVSCQLEAVYGNESHILTGMPGQNEGMDAWVPDKGDAKRYRVRGRELERVAQRELLAAGFLPGQRAAERYTLAGEGKVGAFLANVLPRWKKKWEVKLTPRMESLLSRCDYVAPEVTLRDTGGSWLSVEVDFRSGNGADALSPAEVQRLLQTGLSHHRLAGGRIALVPTDDVAEFHEVLRDCQVRNDGTRYKLEKRFRGYFGEAIRASGWSLGGRSNWKPPEEIFHYEEPQLPERLEKIARPYQKEGIGWLQYLAKNHFGGVLADEMGLGKTLQTLAFLELRRKENKTKLPSLVLCPTSLVINWMDEGKKFAPGLKMLALHGAGRKTLLSKIPDYDLVVTSYALLRRDIAEYEMLEFDSVVLDEAQSIKNRSSQTAVSVKKLTCDHRLVLTGTPLENSLLDLWSIYDFLMPGYLGTATDFRDRYEIPVAKLGDEKAQQRLRQRVRPFLLRRTKAEVARDLPAKIEQISWCELTDEQKGVYRQILEEGRRQVSELAGKASGGKDRIAVLTVLMRLRQACCHLGLLPQNGKTWTEPSGKMEYFLDRLEEAISGGHRMLVFSQFVSLLKIVQEELRRRKVPHCYLDGGTVDRAGEVERFQRNQDIPVFLISLKAGGTGLNLTGADTVIHFDPWWNPAVEDQATARAHRIGQNKIVSSYKLIARDTVEEKIVRLQEKKKELFKGTLVSEEDFVRGLSWTELQELLE